MAQSRFKKMTAEQRREARKEARLNRNKPAPTEPRFADTSRGRFAAGAQVDEPPVKGFQQDPIEAAKINATSESGNNFEDIFLSVVQFLPPEQQQRAFSLFSVFRKQDPVQQKVIVDSLMEVAHENTGPLFDLYRKRIEEDSTYTKAAQERQLNNAKEQYERLVINTDFNTLRDKAKEDRNMAKAIRSITNTAFVERVAGSGIQRRRTQEKIEEAQHNKDDMDVRANQTKMGAGLTLSQIESDIKAKINREDVLRDRDIFDKNQEQEEADRSLFLSLFENSFAGAGDEARDNLPTGDIPAGTDMSVVGGGASAANARAQDILRAGVFSSGGTDAQRKARASEENRVKNAKAEQERMAGVLAKGKEAIDYMFGLNKYRTALRLANRDTSAIDAEINRLKPIASAQLQAARSGRGNFMGNAGAGLPDDLDWWLQKDSDAYQFDGAELVGRYGSKPLDREKLTQELQSFSKTYAPETLGTNYIGLDKDLGSLSYDSINGSPINQYGSMDFNDAYRPPVQTNPMRTDVLAPMTVAPVRSATPVVPPVSSVATQAPTNKPYTVTNPNTGVQYSGGAAKQLSKRLARK